MKIDKKLSSLIWCGAAAWLWILSVGQLQCLADGDDSEIVKPLLAELQSSSAVRRVAAAKRLADLGILASQSSDALAVRLRDENVDVRVIAAYAIACVSDKPVHALRSLVPVLLDSNEHVRYSAEWSIAEIARKVPEELHDLERQEWLSLLDQAIKTMLAQEHQERHRVTIDLAIGKLRSLSSAKLLTELSPIDRSSELGSAVVVSKLFESNDVVGRIQVIHQLSDASLFSDAMRVAVLLSEASREEESLLDFAIAHWGALAQANLASLVQTWNRKRQFTFAETSLIERLQPNSRAILDLCIAWSVDANSKQELRIASIKAIANSLGDRGLAVLCLASLLSDRELSVAQAAVEGLEEIGPEAASATQQIIRAIQSSSEDDFRIAALNALSAIGLDSKTAHEFVCEWLRNSDPMDPLLIALIETSGTFGSNASSVLPKLNQLLSHKSGDVRYATVVAIGRVGLGNVHVVESLIDRIVDTQEEIRIKNHSASALKQSGSIAAQMMIEKWSSSNVEQRESILHALSIIGPEARSAQAICIATIPDVSLPMSMRVAAAEALGKMRSTQNDSVGLLSLWCGPTEPNEIRAASLIALACIDPISATSAIVASIEDPSKLVVASSAFALHLIGESKRSFDLLTSLLDGSESDEVIKQILEEMGPTIRDWLVEAALDRSASTYQRIVCCELACRAEHPRWDRLLELVDDNELAEQFAMVFECHWHTQVMDDTALHVAEIETLVTMMQGKRLSRIGQSRLANLLLPDGLGDGMEDESWQGFVIVRSESMSILSTPPEETVEGGASSALRLADQAPAGVDEPSRSINPGTPVRATAPATAPAPLVHISERPNEVSVYYGTNRIRDSRATTIRESTWSLVVATIFCTLLLGVCFMSFWRASKRMMALQCLVAIAILVPFSWLMIQRTLSDSQASAIAYNGGLAENIEYGRCTVSIPPVHHVGVLEAPSLLKFELKRDVNRHLLMTKVEPMPHDEFITGIRTLQKQRGHNLLVFIHGYNVSFEDAARRTAQMAEDVKFPGAPIFYSWPSQANWYGYGTDQENVQLSVKHIKQFLLDLATKSGAESINLVAHSMGNVGLTEALKEMETRTDKPLFNEVVLAAPDIDADIFKNRVAPFIVSKAKRTTLYTSKTDLALIASRYFNHGPRVGDSGPQVVVFPGIETIDATTVDSSLLGHAYYGGSVSVLSDIEGLLRSEPISHRTYLRQIQEGNTHYWAFDPIKIAQAEETPVQKVVK